MPEREASTGGLAMAEGGWGQPPAGAPGPRWQGAGPPAPSATAPAPARGRTGERGARALPPPGALAALPTASFWRRAAGYVFDLVVLFVLLQAALRLFGGFGDVDFGDVDADAELGATVSWLYLLAMAVRIGYYWTWNSLGWSPGKRMLGLRTIREDGDPPGARHGLVRTLVSLLSDFAFGLGYIWALWDRRGQTWHDRAAGTRVVWIEQAETAESRG